MACGFHPSSCNVPISLPMPTEEMPPALGQTTISSATVCSDLSITDSGHGGSNSACGAADGGSGSSGHPHLSCGTEDLNLEQRHSQERLHSHPFPSLSDDTLNTPSEPTAPSSISLLPSHGSTSVHMPNVVLLQSVPTSFPSTTKSPLPVNPTETSNVVPVAVGPELIATPAPHPPSTTATAAPVTGDDRDESSLLTIKCMFLGDTGVGKSSLVVSYTENGYLHEHHPTAFDNYSVQLCVDEEPICLHIYDTGGQPEMSSLRQMHLSDCHVFLLCFSVMEPTTFQRISQQWLHEIEASGNVSACRILVGCQCDLRNDVARAIELNQRGLQPISAAIAERLAQDIGAVAYVECSALTQKHLKILFDVAISQGLALVRARLQEAARSQREAALKSEKLSRKKNKASAKDEATGSESHQQKSASSWKKLFCVASN